MKKNSNIGASNRSSRVKMTQPSVECLWRPAGSDPVHTFNIGFSHLFYCATANHQIKESFKALNRDCACFITTMLPEQILFLHCTEWRKGFCVIEMRNHKMAAIQFTSQIHVCFTAHWLTICSDVFILVEDIDPLVRTLFTWFSDWQISIEPKKVYV